MNAEAPSITWDHRRRQGNFSMEPTLMRLYATWKEWPPAEYLVCECSNGILLRWRCWREARKLDTDILHINFACISQRRTARKVVLTIQDAGMLDQGANLNGHTIGERVITSQHNTTRHVAGVGALFCHLKNPESIRGQVMALVNEREFRETLMEKGKTNARRFNPKQIMANQEAVSAAI